MNGRVIVYRLHDVEKGNLLKYRRDIRKGFTQSLVDYNGNETIGLSKVLRGESKRDGELIRQYMCIEPDEYVPD